MIYKKKMILSKEEICLWANTSDSKRNFKEGERIINADHIIYCGKNIDFNDSVTLSAKCLSISNLVREPHKIKEEVLSSGRIISMTCTCKAGLGGKMSASTGTLLYCYRLVRILLIFLFFINFIFRI